MSELFQQYFEVAPRIFMIDFLRYVIGAGGVYLVINILLKPVLSGRMVRHRRLRQGQIKREILTSMRTIIIFALVGGTSIFFGTHIGLLHFYASPAQYGWLWVGISIAILIIGHDAWFYWTHRFIHDPRIFRRCHRTHHKSHNPTPFTAYAFDWPEAVINAIYVVIAGLLMPISFLSMFIFLVHMILRNAIGHSGYEIFPARRNGRPLFDWMTTVTHHDMHHEHAGYNYGLYFTFWDRIMKTEHPAYHRRFAQSVGLRLDGAEGLQSDASATAKLP